jgi:hypothetical protein
MDHRALNLNHVENQLSLFSVYGHSTETQFSSSKTSTCKAMTMSAISHIKYLVEKYRGYWTVSSSGKANGEFANRGEACHSALQDGIRVGNMGHDVTIEAHEQNGDTRTVWTSGAKK